MTKAELIAAIAAKADLNKTSAERALNAVLDAMQETLAEEGKITLTGLAPWPWKPARNVPAAIPAPARP